VTCSFEGCSQSVLARGWCRSHYMLWYRPHSPLTSRRPRERICSVEECSQPAKAQGLCRVHYERLQRQGDPADRPAPEVGRTQLLSRGVRPAGHGQRVVHQALQSLAQTWRPHDYPTRPWTHLLCRSLRATGRRQGMVRQSLQSLAALRSPAGPYASAASRALLNRRMRLGRCRQGLVLEALPPLAEERSQPAFPLAASDVHWVRQHSTSQRKGRVSFRDWCILCHESRWALRSGSFEAQAWATQRRARQGR
jgi:hypothetical protein